jgi:hypothetical protein
MAVVAMCDSEIRLTRTALRSATRDKNLAADGVVRVDHGSKPVLGARYP